MKQPKELAILRAHELFQNCAMEGYQVNMAIYSNHCEGEIDVTIFYETVQDWNSILSIITPIIKPDDRIKNSKKGSTRWVVYTISYES